MSRKGDNIGRLTACIDNRGGSALLLFRSVFVMFEKLLSPSRGPNSSEFDPPQVRPRRRIRSVNLDKILNGLKTLTPREHEVLSQVVSGRRNREIASELGITRQGTPQSPSWRRWRPILSLNSSR